MKLQEIGIFAQGVRRTPFNSAATLRQNQNSSRAGASTIEVALRLAYARIFSARFGMKRVVVLTGAGISAESGLGTFRGAGGLWEGVDVQKVVTPEGWLEDPGLVLRFYNERRRQVRAAQPNAAHLALARLEEKFEVNIVTQNVDDLHERAGSTKVLHLHGEILKARSSGKEGAVYDLGDRDIELGDKCEQGRQLRPDIVWFGEPVPAMVRAVSLAQTAEIFLIVGSSLVVYPAASLIDFIPERSSRYLIDLEIPPLARDVGVKCIAAPATTGVPQVVEELLSRH